MFTWILRLVGIFLIAVLVFIIALFYGDMNQAYRGDFQ